MNRKLIAAGIVVMCLPMVFATWLMLSAYWPKMDAVTMHLPMGLRSLVATVVVQKQVKRAKALDPEVVVPRKVNLMLTSADIARRQKENSAKALDLSKQAQAQEEAGDPCAAADTYSLAASKVSGSDADYEYVQGMGRTSLLCGDVNTARAGLEAAVEKQERWIKTADDDDDDLAHTMKDEQVNWEWLVVVYGREKESGLAKSACTSAHPDWKSCVCKLVGKGVSCSAGH